MQRAKEKSAEILESYTEVSELNDDERTKLKLDINDFLFTNLPAKVSVGQMEVLATVIFDMVTNPEDYLNP